MQNADPCRPAFVLVEHRGFEPLTFSLRKPPCRGLAPLGGGFTPADGCSGAVDSNSGARRGPAPKPVFDFRSGAVHAGENFATASVSGMDRGGTLADYAMWVRAAGQTHTLQHMMKWDGSPTLPAREYPAEEREIRFFFDYGHPWPLWENYTDEYAMTTASPPSSWRCCVSVASCGAAKTSMADGTPRRPRSSMRQPAVKPWPCCVRRSSRSRSCASRSSQQRTRAP